VVAGRETDRSHFDRLKKSFIFNILRESLTNWLEPIGAGIVAAGERMRPVNKSSVRRACTGSGKDSA
jgi:hypothetical protein